MGIPGGIGDRRPTPCQVLGGPLAARRRRAPTRKRWRLMTVPSFGSLHSPPSPYSPWFVRVGGWLHLIVLILLSPVICRTNTLL